MRYEEERQKKNYEMNENGDKELVSVIITVFNLEKYIVECIDSVISQTYRNLEIIVVDDGSADSGYEKICKFAEKDDRIKPFTKANGGVSSARNVGLDVMSGDYVMFVDGDDLLAADAIEECLRYIRADVETDIVSFACEKFYDDIKNNDDHSVTESETLSHEEYLHTIARGDFDSGIVCAKLYRSCIWDDLRFPEGITREDEYINADVYCLARKAVRMSRKMYYYRMREGSIIHTESEESRRNTLEAFSHRIDVLCNGSKDDNLYKFRYIEAIMDLYPYCDDTEKESLWREFVDFFTLANREILWKRRVLVLLFRISPKIWIKVRRR